MRERIETAPYPISAPLFCSLAAHVRFYPLIEFLFLLCRLVGEAYLHEMDVGTEKGRSNLLLIVIAPKQESDTHNKTSSGLRLSER